MTMTPLSAFLLSVAIVFAAKTLAWLIQLRTRNAGLVDAIWGWTLGGLAPLYALLGTAPTEVRVLLALLGGLWGLRLGAHLWRRNYGKPEDWRYARFRRQWGAGGAGGTAPERSAMGAGAGASAASRTHSFANTVSAADVKMFWFFQFQNIFTLLLSASAFLIPAYRSDSPPALCLGLSVLIWIGAVAGEGIADVQMERFRANPDNKGRVCRDGLWRYSRHPNYFFECLHWLAYVPLALGAPWGWLSLAAPLVMAWLLLKLSGVPMLEAEMAKRKAGYTEYMHSTSVLIPLPPKTR